MRVEGKAESTTYFDLEIFQLESKQLRLEMVFDLNLLKYGL